MIVQAVSLLSPGPILLRHTMASLHLNFPTEFPGTCLAGNCWDTGDLAVVILVMAASYTSNSCGLSARSPL